MTTTRNKIGATGAVMPGKVSKWLRAIRQILCWHNQYEAVRLNEDGGPGWYVFLCRACGLDVWPGGGISR